MANILLINPAEKFSNVDIEIWKGKQKNHQFVLIEEKGVNEEDVIPSYPETNILLCTYGKYTSKLLSQLPKLKAVIATTTATEYIDLDYCDKHKVDFFNISGYSGTAIAEHLLALIFMLARKLTLATKMINSPSQEELLGFELKGKTLGLLGYGHIGKAFTAITSSLGMRTIVFNRSPINASLEQLTLEELLPKSDILVCVLPLNSDTKQLMNADRLALLKRGAHIVSTSPDEIFDMSAVESMLKSGALGGAAFDIHSEHPELYPLPNFIATRTKGWYTKECVERRTQAFLAVLDDYLRNRVQEQKQW